MGCCGRQVGMWLDETRMVVLTCWSDVGHGWECHDRCRDVRWEPGSGVDTTGRRYLIDLADVPVEDLAALRQAAHAVAS